MQWPDQWDKLKKNAFLLYTFCLRMFTVGSKVKRYHGVGMKLPASKVQSSNKSYVTQGSALWS